MCCPIKAIVRAEMKVGWGSGVGPDLQVPELQTKSSGKQTQPNKIDQKKGFQFLCYMCQENFNQGRL